MSPTRTHPKATDRASVARAPGDSQRSYDATSRSALAGRPSAASARTCTGSSVRANRIADFFWRRRQRVGRRLLEIWRRPERGAPCFGRFLPLPHGRARLRELELQVASPTELNSCAREHAVRALRRAALQQQASI